MYFAIAGMSKYCSSIGFSLAARCLSVSLAAGAISVMALLLTSWMKVVGSAAA